ncbi:MAG: acetyl-CoA hydrolase/transferase family protein [Syntrophomonadaceae bacterium]
MGKTYTDELKSKTVSAQEAVKVVKSGDWVAYSHFAMGPQALDKALAERKDELFNVNIRGVCPLFEPEVALVEPKYEHFIYNSGFLSADDRKLGDRCFHLPGMYRNSPLTIRLGHSAPVRVAFMMTAPMDKHGYFNFGTSCSYHRAVCDQADIIIVETNDKTPTCLGGEQESVHISEVTYVVEGDNKPLKAFPQDVPYTEVEKGIANAIIEEIEDGCTVQLGIGGLANYIGKMIAQSDLKDLGMHSEMMNDSYVDLFERGILTGRRKNVDKGKMVYTFALGSQNLYDFLDNNPACAIYPVDITNDPQRIAANDKVIAINNALYVDLYGQVCAEALDFRQISGTGGQVDFTYGAWLSKGGKSFICLPSTRKLKDGRVISRIQPFMPVGAIVTDPRTLPMFIVTEYGKANIMGKSSWARAEMLIDIAHPDFRDELIKSAQKQKIWTRSNKIE